MFNKKTQNEMKEIKQSIKIHQIINQIEYITAHIRTNCQKLVQEAMNGKIITITTKINGEKSTVYTIKG